MSSYAEHLIAKFAGKGLLVDTNLLLVYIVGRFDPEIISTNRFDRISAYTSDDFHLLQQLFLLFSKTLTTPHVLAEVSNWIGYLPAERKEACLLFLSNLIPSFVEVFQSSASLSQHPRFHFLGLADTALASVAHEHLIVTDDLRFIAHLNAMGLEALNINHLRQLRWLAQ